MNRKEQKLSTDYADFTDFSKPNHQDFRSTSPFYVTLSDSEGFLFMKSEILIALADGARGMTSGSSMDKSSQGA
jgi:hypothetical protein